MPRAKLPPPPTTRTSGWLPWSGLRASAQAFVIAVGQPVAVRARLAAAAAHGEIGGEGETVVRDPSIVDRARTPPLPARSSGAARRRDSAAMVSRRWGTERAEHSGRALRCVLSNARVCFLRFP